MFTTATMLMLLSMGACQSTHTKNNVREPASEIPSKPEASCPSNLKRGLERGDWKIQKESADKIEKAFADSTLRTDEKIRTLFDELLAYKIKTSPKRVQSRLKEIVDYARFEAAGHFIPIAYDNATKNFEYIGASFADKDSVRWGLAQHLTLMHELTHAEVDFKYPGISWLHNNSARFSQFFTATPSVIAPTIRYFDEKNAISAQWELVSRIPQKQREEFLQVLSKHTFLDRGEVSYIVRASLENAGLSKKEFVKKMMSIHGYTFARLYLMYGWGTFGIFKGIAIMLATTQIFNHMHNSSTENDQDKRTVLPYPIDVIVMIQLYDIILGDD